MNYPIIDSARNTPIPHDQLDLPPFQREEETHPEDYDADKGLLDAVNVALIMGQPLLITGDPGSGKTRLAFRIAWILGLEPVLTYATKSTSTAKDLFYSYDYLARFHAANANQNISPERFITYHALGEALIRANPKSLVENVLPPGFEHDKPKRSVVLIDEIDKAPRDFPNDILNEIENLSFRIPELGRNPESGSICEVTTNKKHAPLIFITSNSEKLLPRPFLRRCVYYHIDFPDDKRMIRIVTNRVKRIPSYMGKTNNVDQTFISQAVTLFFNIREKLPKETQPSTAELIMWVAAMREISNKSNPIEQDPDAVKAAMAGLIKSKTDQQTALDIYGNGSWKNKTNA